MPGTRDKNCLSLKKLFPRLETIATVHGTDKTKHKVSISSRDEGD